MACGGDDFARYFLLKEDYQHDKTRCTFLEITDALNVDIFVISHENRSIS